MTEFPASVISVIGFRVSGTKGLAKYITTLRTRTLDIKSPKPYMIPVLGALNRNTKP